MYFGSVRFFKHLILTVTALLIIVPTVLCIIFAVDNAKKSEEIDRLNSRLSAQSEDISASATESSDDSKGDSTAENTNKAEPSVTESKPAETTTAQTTAQTTPVASSQTETTPDTTKEPASTPESSDETSNSNADDKLYTELYPELYADKYDGEYEDSKNTVYLTFDDGPSVLTENLLYYLRQENVKATFFVVPERTEYCYSLLKEISDAGHTIGIHSASHDYEKIYASVDAFLDDFKEAYDIVLEATGKAPDIYRFPGGSVNDYNAATRDDIIAEMDRRGFTYFDWNVDSNDWQGYGWTTLYTNVLADAQEFSTPVILFHDTGDRDNTVLVIEDIIKALKDKGYKFGSLSQKTEPIQFQ